MQYGRRSVDGLSADAETNRPVFLSLSLVRLCCTDRRKWRAASVIWPAFITCCLRCLRICRTRSWLVELRVCSWAARRLCLPSLQRYSHTTCEALKYAYMHTHALVQSFLPLQWIISKYEVSVIIMHCIIRNEALQCVHLHVSSS